jgi:uncharacterized membrane protein
MKIKSKNKNKKLSTDSVKYTFFSYIILILVFICCLLAINFIITVNIFGYIGMLILISILGASHKLLISKQYKKNE